jgi:hypothetical protein
MFALILIGYWNTLENLCLPVFVYRPCTRDNVRIGKTGGIADRSVDLQE